MTSSEKFLLRPCPYCGKGKLSKSAKECPECGYRSPYEGQREFLENLRNICAFLGGFTPAAVVQLIGDIQIVIAGFFLTASVIFLSILICSTIFTWRLPESSIFEKEDLKQGTVGTICLIFIAAFWTGVVVSLIGLVLLAFMLNKCAGIIILVLGFFGVASMVIQIKVPLVSSPENQPHDED